MPPKRKNETRIAKILAPVPVDVLDQFVREGPLTAAEVEAATRRFKKAIIERALGAELTHHLGYAAGEPKCGTTAHYVLQVRQHGLRELGPNVDEAVDWCSHITLNEMDPTLRSRLSRD